MNMPDIAVSRATSSAQEALPATMALPAHQDIILPAIPPSPRHAMNRSEEEGPSPPGSEDVAIMEITVHLSSRHLPDAREETAPSRW